MCIDAKKNVCLIGLGLITQHYATGLAESGTLRLCAVADLNEEAIGRKHFSQYPFYTDYQEMLSAEQPDYVIISTAPASHFQIALDCLNRGIHVIVEKPVTLSMKELQLLATVAQEKNLIFYTLFHWLGGIEVIEFSQKYCLQNIQNIQVTVLDPYCDQPGIINPDRRPLMGAWIDSGVNALSMIRQWLPFHDVKILRTDSQRCKESGLPFYVNVHLLIDGVPTEITVDWRQKINRKESFVVVNGQKIHINHSGQCLNGDAALNQDQMPRLVQHYYNLFQQFDGNSNTDISLSVHNLLFEVDAAL